MRLEFWRNLFDVIFYLDKLTDKRSKDDQSEDGEAERKSAEIVCLEDTPQNLV